MSGGEPISAATSGFAGNLQADSGSLLMRRVGTETGARKEAMLTAIAVALAWCGLAGGEPADFF